MGGSGRASRDAEIAESQEMGHPDLVAAMGGDETDQRSRARA